MTATTELRQQVIHQLNALRPMYGGTDAQFAKKWGINATSYSTIKNGGIDGNVLRESKWLDLARELGINKDQNVWKFARTEVFTRIEEEVTFCKNASKSLMLVDEPEIGKTVAGQYLSKSLKNCFYVDCSQAKTRIQFARQFAKAIGCDSNGKHVEVKMGIKKHLCNLHQPVVILDEAGDLDYTTLMELKEFWNGTDGRCGWYMMGADGLRTKIEKGIQNKKAGFREMFSRFNGKYMSIVPTEITEKQQFYAKLVTDVVSVNAPHYNVKQLVNKCLGNLAKDETGGLRYAQTKILLDRHETN